MKNNPEPIMSALENGGAAFPIPGLHEDSDFNGMSLRDYFAAKAPISIQDAMTACYFESSHISALSKSKRIEVMQKLAEMQFEYADAMLLERAK